MPPISYLNEISDEEKVFMNIALYSFWSYYFYEFGTFILQIINLKK